MLKHEHIVGALATAFTIAQHSPSERRKVGAVVIARDAVENRPHILGWGANGMPTGHQTNCCEIPAPSDYVPYAGDPHAGLATHPDVVHAERRALRQAGDRAKNAIVVCTDTPCPDCMAELNALGISQFITNKLAALIFFIACCCLLFGKVTFREAAAMFAGSFCVFALPYAAEWILERISDFNRCVKDWVRG